MQTQLLYDKDFPSFVKFGAIGNLMAYELSQAFNPLLILTSGSDWTDNDAALQKYSNFIDCLVEQYNSFSLTKYDGTKNLFVNGDITKEENMADAWSKVITYKVFEKEVTNGNISANFRLPGLNLTIDQLHFVSNSIPWCRTARPGYYATINDDSTSAAVPARVNIPNGNMQQFSQVFHCDEKSFMNFKQKCEFW